MEKSANSKEIVVGLGQADVAQKCSWLGYPELGPYLGLWVPNLDCLGQFRPITRVPEALIVSHFIWVSDSR